MKTPNLSPGAMAFWAFVAPPTLAVVCILLAVAALTLWPVASLALWMTRPKRKVLATVPLEPYGCHPDPSLGRYPTD